MISIFSPRVTTPYPVAPTKSSATPCRSVRSLRVQIASPVAGSMAASSVLFAISSASRKASPLLRSASPGRGTATEAKKLMSLGLV